LRKYFWHLLNEAQHCYLQLAQLNKEKLGINSNEYIVSLNQLASFYSSIGNFNLAQKKYQEALFILKHRKEVHKDLYFNVLLNIVNLKFDNSTSNYDLEEIEKHYHQKLIANYLFLAEDEKVVEEEKVVEHETEFGTIKRKRNKSSESILDQ
jgi:tetratricopeptide (TPR) repeat protein